MQTATALDLMQKRSLEEIGPIFEEYYDLIYRTAYSITRSPQDAEDVAQTIFLRLLRRGTTPDLTKNPKGYFYRAAVNVALQSIRFRDRHLLSADCEKLNRGKTAENSEPSHQDEEMDQRLWRAIAELKETAAQILILRYIDNQSLSEIAKLLGTTKSTVAVSLFRSRARLKKLIRENLS